MKTGEGRNVREVEEVLRFRHSENAPSFVVGTPAKLPSKEAAGSGPGFSMCPERQGDRSEATAHQPRFQRLLPAERVDVLGVASDLMYDNRCVIIRDGTA